jgi:xylulokinase
MERMRGLGIAVESVRLVGGGSRNALWRKILADVLEVPVVRLLEPESAALGAAVQALWTERREAGDDASADAVAAPFIRTEKRATLPDAARSRTYRHAGAAFRDLTGRIFGTP